MTEPPPRDDGGRVAWFHCFAGVSGDMALGALLDAGADLDEVRALLQRLPVAGWTLDAEATMRGGIAATRALVGAPEDGTARTHAAIVGIVRAATLPSRVTGRALATFAALAEVEAQLHRHAVADVHFHEVGGLDVDRVAASAVATGTGTIRAAHGVLPNPAPAVVGLLARAGAPVRGLALDSELTTPTGAALLVALATAWGPIPAMSVAASGFGAGARDHAAVPNLTQVVVGRAAASVGSGSSGDGQPVVLLEANVDDVTGEALADAVTALLDAGAHDAWLVPVVMKKGRPAHVVSALVDVAAVGHVRDVLVRTTGTFGVRRTTLDRTPLPRQLVSVEVQGHPVRLKVGAHRAKVEHDDAAAVASATGMPLAEVVSQAEEAWRHRPPEAQG